MSQNCKNDSHIGLKDSLIVSLEKLYCSQYHLVFFFSFENGRLNLAK